MRIQYKGRTFELTKLTFQIKSKSDDIRAIFEIKSYKWVKNPEHPEGRPEYIECSEDEEGAIKKPFFIECFYGADEDEEELIDTAKHYIDRYDWQH